MGKKVINIKKKIQERIIVTSNDIVLLILLAVFFLFIFGGISFFKLNGDIEENFVCGDGTLYGTCSLNKPYYCFNETLIKKASVCGCPENLNNDGENCGSSYQTSPKEVSLKYILRGEEKEIDYVVYEGLVDYLFNLPKGINSNGGSQPRRIDFKLKNINEKEQRELLLPLVVKIQNLAFSKEDQMRIAVSLVQNIEYKESEKTFMLRGDEFNYSRYPYEVIYDMQGICGEKSELLAFLLRELGYEVAFFYHNKENHESIGIKCPVKNSLDNTGYCFVETTGPSIITDDLIEYVDGVMLESSPEVNLISKGMSLGDNLYEYKDAKDLGRIRSKGESIFSKGKFEELKEKYGLVEVYNLG